jgi:hypothetical protein
MPVITYTAEGFPSTYGGALAGTFSVNLSWEEIIWAAISVGKAQLAHLSQYGVFSTFEFIYRAAIIYANLLESPSGVLKRSSAYDGLDPSEKGAISYFIGMTFAKLFASRLLSVPWLMHLDVYRQQLQPVLQGRSKPDFVGLNSNNDWVVLEAKGRTNDFEESVMQTAKAQTQNLTTIQGSLPILRVASLACFAAGNLKFVMRDPERKKGGEKLPDLPLNKRDFLTIYYRPFQTWLDQADGVRVITVDGLRYRVGSFPGFDLFIGYPEEGMNRLAREATLGEHGEFVGSDGVLVRLGPIWSAEKMRLQPQERNRSQT